MASPSEGLIAVEPTASAMMSGMEASTATSPETPPEAVEGATAPEDAPDGTSEGTAPETRERDESGRLLSREAARYRTQLRETEAERDSLREQLDRHQRIEVERLAAGAGLAVAADVWQFGASSGHASRRGWVDRRARPSRAWSPTSSKPRPGLSAPEDGDLGVGRGGTADHDATRSGCRSY